MNRLRSILFAFCGLSICVCSNAQDAIEGPNLNIGSGNTLNGNRGNAIGISHWLGGNNSLAVGNNDTIMDYANSCIALGSVNRINGLGSMAIGSGIKIDGNRSMGIGHNLRLTGHTGCMVIGNGFIGAGGNPNAFLENNYENCLIIGMHSTKPTLTISPSPNDYPYGDTICKTGRIAIGDVPLSDIEAKLHIRSDFDEDAGLFLEPKSPATANTFIHLRDRMHGIKVDSTGAMFIVSKRINNNGYEQSNPLVLNGYVGINIDDGDVARMFSHSYNSLFVKGGIITDRVSIKTYNASWWPDYVFDHDYKLMPLSDLREYIGQYHHLPDVPSESEVQEQGIELGDMQGVLLKKIEELTLYTLQLQEQVEKMQKEINMLKGK